MNSSPKYLVLLWGMWLFTLSTLALGQGPDASEWRPISDPNEKNITAEAVVSGKFVAGRKTGTAQFIVACERRRNECMDCGEKAFQMEMIYRLSWIIPPQSSFYFEPFALGGGAQYDLATVQIGSNPPTPRHSTEVVMSDGNWQINVYAKPEDINALETSDIPQANVKLVLNRFTDFGLPALVIRNKIPAVDSAFQSVLDACSNSVYRGPDFSMCEPRSNEELIEVKVCYALAPEHCDDPEKTHDGAVWHLSRLGSEVPEADRNYRLRCGYKLKGADDTITTVTELGLSRKLTECHEQLHPLSVSCK